MTFDFPEWWDYMLKGSSLYKLGRYKEAIECYEAVIKIDPQHIGGYNGKGNCLSKLGRYGEAIECYNAGIKIGTQLPNGYQGKGDCLLELKRYDEALECYNEAIKIDPKQFLVYKKKGDCLIELGRYEEAIECYNAAISFDKEKPALAYSGLGRAYYFKGQYETAKVYLDKCLEINCESVDALLYLGKTLYKMHRYDDAVTVLRKSLIPATNDRMNMNTLSEIESEIKRIVEYKDRIDKKHEVFNDENSRSTQIIYNITGDYVNGGTVIKDDAIVNRLDSDKSAIRRIYTSKAESELFSEGLGNEKRICPKCKAVVEDGQRFCHICGSELI